MRVKVYFNIQKKMFSIMANEGDRKGIVIAHCHEVYLRDVVFKVSEASRQRVIKEKQKNVHAFAVGTLITKPFSHHGEEEVSYNPYVAGHFFMKSNDEPVHKAKYAKLYVENNKGFILI
jgi:hypothetical protein